MVPRRGAVPKADGDACDDDKLRQNAQYHADNNNLENVRRRSWSKLWPGKSAPGAKGALLSTFGGSIGNGFRVDSLRENDSSYPVRFALVLSDSLEKQRAAVRSFREDFHLLQMEELARGDHGLMEMLRHAVWRQDPLVRLLVTFWDLSRGDKIDNEGLELTKNVRPPGRRSP